jgi:hypothetical protein
LIVAIGMLWPGSGRADQVQTRAWAHGQYGRIVFDWPSPVTFRADVSEDTLKVTFGRSIATSFDFVKRNLGQYIADIAVSDGGKTVIAKLKRPLRMRSFVNNKAVVVDLIVPTAASANGDPKPSNRAASSKAEPTAPLLDVRTGKHLGFGRVVFDGAGQATYNVRKSGDRVVVRFDRPARVDLAKLKTILPHPVSGVTASQARGGLSIAFAVPSDARVRHFRDGSKIVVDVLSGPGRTAAKKPDPSSAAKPAELQKPAAAAPKQTVPAKSAPRPLALVPKIERKPRKASKPDRPEKRPLRRHAKTFGPRAAIVTVDARRTGNDLAVTFNWRQDVAAAAFVRDGRLWLVFDRPARVALGPVRSSGSGIVENIEQYPQQGATVLGLSVPERYRIAIGRDGAKWTLDLNDGNPEAGRDGELPVRVDAGGNGRVRVVLPVKSPGRSVAFRDPVVGDTLIAVALNESGQRTARPRDFVEFSLLPTIQGVAVRKVSEDVRVGIDEGSVVISRPDGLNVTPRENIARVPVNLEIDRALWDIAAWQGGPREDYQRNKHILIDRIIKAPPAQRNAARIDLAKFYLAHEMSADALGVVQTVVRQRPTSPQLTTLRAIRGAANFLLGHYGDALTDFDHRHLKDEPGVAPWRAAIAAKRGDWRSANDGFTGAEQVLARLPRNLAVRFKLMAFEAALASEDLKRASRLAESLRLDRLSAHRGEYFDLLRGHLFKKEGQPKKALEIWEALATSDNRMVRAKAAFAQIETLRDLKEIEPQEAVARLDKLSFAWRGDAYEFDLLRRLGELYIAGKDYRRGLIRLRQAVSYFENVEGADAVAKRMADYFKKLYLDGAADDLPPVKALALYEEFRELTPPGVEGEKMVRRLADRLAKVDLLDEAAELLAHQIEYRLSGKQKARVAARLAEIRLLDREPALALQALRNSDEPELPEELARDRRRIEARALGQLNRPKAAMAVLKGDLDRAANAVRLEILWQTRSWRETADVIQRSMGFRGVEPGNEQEAQRVLRWAVALAMIDDTSGLAALRERFLADMSSTKYAKPFRAIVGGRNGKARDYKSLAEQIGDLDNLKTFMSSIGENPQSAGRDAAN